MGGFSANAGIWKNGEPLDVEEAKTSGRNEMTIMNTIFQK